MEQLVIGVVIIGSLLILLVMVGGYKTPKSNQEDTLDNNDKSKN